jgi:hypothetical protein
MGLGGGSDDVGDRAATAVARQARRASSIAMTRGVTTAVTLNRLAVAAARGNIGRERMKT